ncbi:TetR/AcrR family transcriptional regulator [Rathayibacter tanaceti]|uniref:TetR family transcriptional regulator n=2 Tax=Rathayibacter tanaceti TaxID=1671680 RepID=A0ACD2XKZ7_9MICO|nr:TetR/AcrR family transcriptional regulator [Rathayibacter tanaceti]KZX19952.1 putative HTH-type transcriptional regulator TtgW [Rathayibacter tanaceti]QHC54371.1 TetR family transcriptional regulator [Rathayibacter tanaceti]TCO38054.1 TetR family transcriptional regulator [Rathayibacter tanaceti]
MTAIDATPPETPRRSRTRERLLDAAYDVFAETGVHSASVEQICERAGFSRGAFYSNFSSKEELFFALMERENGARVTALVEQMGRTIPKIVDSDEPLTAERLAVVILDFLQGPVTDSRRWCVVESEFELLALRDARIAPQYRDFRAGFDASLVQIVHGALHHVGREFSLEPRTAVRLLIAGYDDAVKQSILEDESEAAALERLRTTLTAIVLATSVADT